MKHRRQPSLATRCSCRGAGSRTRRQRYGRITATAIVAASALLTACETTSIPGLNVRAEPTTASPVIASIEDTETRVDIECFTRGESIHGDTVWYRIDAPYEGYVTNYYVHTNRNILATTPTC